MNHFRRLAFNCLVIVIFGAMLPPAGAQTQAIDIAWLPVTDAERNMKEPVVDKDAGV